MYGLSMIFSQPVHCMYIISSHYIYILYLKNDTVCLQSLSKWRNDRILHGASGRIHFGPDCRFLVTVAEIAAFGFIFCYFIPRDECTAFYDRYTPLPSFYYIAMWGEKEEENQKLFLLYLIYHQPKNHFFFPFLRNVSLRLFGYITCVLWRWLAKTLDR